MDPSKTPSCSTETGVNYPAPAITVLPEPPTEGSRADGGEGFFAPETLAAFIARVQAASPPLVAEAPSTASLAERMAYLTHQHHVILTELFGPDAV